MSERCTNCRSDLPPYWWETRLPQATWTEEQARATANRQQSELAYRSMLNRLYSWTSLQEIDSP